jgi:ribosome-associated protein
VTASRVEAVFDVAASEVLSDAQKRRVMARCGPRVTAVAQESRGQARNRQLALERLAARIDHALQVPRARRPTKPTKASKERRLTAKRRTSERKAERRKPGLGG